MTYLETEPEKVRFFCEQLKVPESLSSRQDLSRTARTSQPTVRYFVDKFPMFLAMTLSSPVVTFTYIQGAEASTDGICSSSGSLPAALPAAFRVPIPLSRADGFALREGKGTVRFSGRRFRFESDVAGDILRYFRVRKAWDLKQYAALTDARPDFPQSRARRDSPGTGSNTCIADGKPGE